jgi:peroxiredoxin
MTTLSAGDDAPDFTLNTADGHTYDLVGALRQGPVLIVFVKTTCGTCDLLFPYLNQFIEAYGDEGWHLWAISQDGPDRSRDYARRQEARFPVLVDGPGWPVSSAYDPPATPTLFLIAPDGRVEETSVGFSKDDLNGTSRRLAGHLGRSPLTVAEADDGRPPFRPG